MTNGGLCPRTVFRRIRKAIGRASCLAPRRGDLYKFYVEGAGGSGYKRDPYGREVTPDPPFPHCNNVVRDPQTYLWHDQGFVTPNYSDMIVYQLHVGSYAPSAPGAMGTFLDVVEKIEYLAALGVNTIQLLPIDEAETDPTLGYNGADYFSPELVIRRL